MATSTSAPGRKNHRQAHDTRSVRCLTHLLLLPEKRQDAVVGRSLFTSAASTRAASDYIRLHAGDKDTLAVSLYRIQRFGECQIPEPNTGYVAVAAGWLTSLAVRGYPRGDLDVDLNDPAAFAACLTGPGGTEPPPGCTPEQFSRADIDNNDEADLADFDQFQTVLIGSQ